jgi:hypothetical protein
MIKKVLGKLLKQVEEVQQDMGKLQAALQNHFVEGTAGAGMVTVVANARKEIINIKFDMTTINPDDVEMLEELTVVAVNQALENADAYAQQEMQKVTGIINNLPAHFKELELSE